MVDGTVPEFFVEDHGQGVQLTQFKHHAADGDGVRLHFVPLFLQRRQLGFGFFEAVAQFSVSGTVSSPISFLTEIIAFVSEPLAELKL